MTNPVREWYPDTVYHITTRGNRKYDIFRDIEDFQVYLKILKNSLEYFKEQYEIVCYCLMSNHVHILVDTKSKHLKYFVSRINSIYARFFNNKYNCIGYLYQGRYFSKPIETGFRLLDASKYIHLNPVKANMVKKPEEYIWSSYSMYINKKVDKFINSRKVLQFFNDGDVNNQRYLYKNFVENQFLPPGVMNKL